MRLELFPFRFRDPLTRKWVRARYVAERHVIAERYAEYEIIGPPEIRDVEPDARYYNPASAERQMDRAAVGNVGAVIAVARCAVGERRRLVVAGIAAQSRVEFHRADAPDQRQPHAISAAGRL